MVVTSGDSCIKCVHWKPRTGLRYQSKDWGCKCDVSDVGWPEQSNGNCKYYKKLLEK